jgi:hypothetical protein
MDVLEAAMPGAVFLLNSPYSAAEVWDKLPKSTQQSMLNKKIEFYVIDGYSVARQAGMGTRINTIMQTCFFAISGVLPREEAIAQIKKSIQKTYGKRGEAGHRVVELRSDSIHFAQCARVCPQRARPDCGRQGRSAPSQRNSCRRHLPDRHGTVGETQYCAVHSRVG